MISVQYSSPFLVALRRVLTIACGTLLLLQANVVRAAVPTISQIGPQENVGSESWRLSIAADTEGQPHIVGQGDRGVLNFFDKIDGKWSGDTATSSSELNFPRTVIDQHNNRQWASAIMIQIGDANACGMAIYTRSNVNNAPSGIYSTKSLVGDPSGIPLCMIDIDPKKTDIAYVYGNFGCWQEFGVNGNGTIRNGSSGQTLIARNLGERNIYGFAISQAASSGASIWHASYVGHPDLGSVRYSGYQNSAIGETAWNDPLAYGDQAWHEDNYGSACADNKNPKAAYFTIHGRDGYIYAQVYNGSKMLSPIGTLYRMRSDAQYMRYAPQWAAAKDGGAWLCWEHGGHINIRYFGSDGVQSATIDLGSGGQGAIACDKEGNLHITYQGGGYTRYRKITISGFGPISPKGTISDSTPDFVWDDTSKAPAGYRVVVDDATNGVVMDITTNATVKSVPSTVTLDIGNYHWHIGRILATSTEWSPATDFRVVPPPPTLMYPVNNYSVSMPQDLLFMWSQVDNGDRYQLWIKKDGAKMTNIWFSGSTTTNWTPPNVGAWTAGNYSWWGMASNSIKKVASDWSPEGKFRLAGPAAPTLLSPANRANVVCTNPLQLVWSESRGATYYWLYIKKHGADMWNKVGITATNWSPGGAGEPGNDSFDPDSYQWWVQPFGIYGAGTWSASNAFYRTRVMNPDNGAVVTDLKPLFTWTGSAGATTYRLWVRKDGVTYYNSFVGPTTFWTPTFNLPHGNYEWWIQPWVGSTEGLWLDSATFTIPDRTPVASVLVSPTSTVVQAAGNALFQWGAVPFASHYRAWANKNGSFFYSAWFEGAVSNRLALSIGDYQWWVQTWNVDGYGPWTAVGDFSVGKCRPISPANGTAFNQTLPVLQWQGLASATDYELYVNRNGVKYLNRRTGSAAPVWGPTDPWPTGNYQWFVRNVGGSWSKPSTLQTLWGIPGTVALVAPVTGTQAAGSVNYQFLADVNATAYRVYIKRNEEKFHDAWHTTGLQTAGTTQTVAIAGHSTGNYTWWVMARGADGTSASWSATGTFSIP